MKKLTIFIVLFLLLACSGTAFGANSAGVNNIAATATKSSVDLPEHTVDLPQIQSELFSLKSRVNQLEADIRSVRNNNDRHEAVGLVLILFGTVCALWAQNTGRNPWVWFFAGMFFNVLTALAMLKRNSDERS